MADIAVIDYGMGNLRSVAKAFEHVAPQLDIIVSSDPDEISKAGRVVFPGVGAMPDCIRELESRGLREAVVEAAKAKPFLGICLGMQALFESSEEGNAAGLGILPGRVLRFPAEAMVDDKGQKLKVPHIGWNEVHQAAEHPMWSGIPTGARFYFVHSYYVEAGDPDLVAGFTLYPFAFTAAVARDNIFAVQFHPEKSQATGLTLLANFVMWDGQAQVSACGADACL
ncbi:MAG: imidazole glycerol phosphate synthase subunit HisH [Sulfurimicrobium sp.]|nr:imidazole glycerol phosphate synthase subunit HisH [Sulfurimicrobium sp.]MDP1703145.1 imidazole glycerol phosphate synthase subunit HisH [Sulfurimicrobium sp.]MDP2197087.1 imidazole glycerol phosphate synthase subunit HisH [Sulfurimicrobium sp.]MDP3688127.1 imidazole glycerol phosphate synthase subunit HisH [Sulfurimicrobium sp.]